MSAAVSRLSRSVAGRCAFTLIELLVVIVILGILMAVAVPTFLAQQTKAQDSRTQQYLTTAFKAIRAGTPDTNNQYPSSTSMVSWITSSEPELTAKRGDCLSGVTSAPVDAVLVDPSSTPTSLELCARSQSGNVWKLTASATGAQQLLDGTLVPLTVSGNEITDATRAADVQGDGLSTDSSTGIWEGTTNLAPNGGFETNTTGWAVDDNGAASMTFTRDNSVSKFGSWSGKIVNTEAGVDDFVGGMIPATASTTYTFSAWVFCPTFTGGATNNRGILLVGYQGTTPNGTAATASLTGTTSGWVRLSATATTGASADHLAFRIYAPQGTVYWDGIQVEQKPYATPYVDTNGASATRPVGDVKAPASLLNATQGWVVERVRLDEGLPDPHTAYWGGFFDWGENNTDSIEMYLSPGSSFVALRRIRGGVISGSGWSSTVNSSTDPKAAGSYITVVGDWTAAQVGVSVDGGTFTTVNNATIPTITATSFDIGRRLTIEAIDGDILWFACGTGTLTDADAATINSWGNTDPNRSSFPSAAQATMVWNGVDSNGSLK